MYDLNSTLWDARKRIRGKLLAVILGRAARKWTSAGREFQEANERIVQASVMDAPLRSYAVGGPPMEVPEAIVLILNAKIFEAIRKMLEKDRS